MDNVNDQQPPKNPSGSEPDDFPDDFAREEERTELFIRLLAEHERRLAAYVMTFVPRVADAEDILQETKLALWRSFENFEIGTNFGAWARRAAFHRILDFRKRKGRESQRLCFSDSCYEQLAATFERGEERREAQAKELSRCLARLQPNHREIVSLRYLEGLSVEQIAGRVGRTVAATYRVLSRIRLALRDCVQGPSTPSAEAHS